MEELMKVTQLPIIQERLRSKKAEVDQICATAEGLVCTAETVQACKAYRADLRKLADEAEAQRKAVKAAIMQPYDAFEAVYKECVIDAVKRADKVLKEKIDSVESEIKAVRENELQQYFAELKTAYHLEWLTWQQTGIRVTLTDAKGSSKKAKEGLRAWVEKIAQDVEYILRDEDAAAIMAEYKRSLDMVQAHNIVLERKEREERERQEAERRREEMERRKAAAAEAEAERQRQMAEAAQAVEAPEVIEEPEEEVQPAEQPQEPLLTITFTVTDTRERLIALRTWLKEHEYNYN